MSPIAHCVSYPKSGRTWLRYMLGHLLDNDTIIYHHDGFEFNDGARPPHDFSLQRRLQQYPSSFRMIYIDRDPRDVMVSLYHQVTGRFADYFEYQGNLSDFIRDDYFGAEVLNKFRAMWSEILVQRPFLHLSYEQMHRDPVAVLDRVMNYLGYEIPIERIWSAVDAGHIDNMRAVEMEGNFPKPWLRPRQGHTKVRKGKVGGYREEMKGSDIAYLDSLFASRTNINTGQKAHAINSPVYSSKPKPERDTDSKNVEADMAYIKKLVGGCSDNEVQYLADLAEKQVDKGCVVEIGSYRGKSALAFRYGMLRAEPQIPKPLIYCIDPHAVFEGVYGGKYGAQDRAEFYRIMLETKGYEDIALVNLNGADVGAAWKRKIGLLFIDGDHSYEGVKKDIEAWLPACDEDTLILFDDAVDPQIGPYKVIKEYVEKAKIKEHSRCGKIIAFTVVPQTG